MKKLILAAGIILIVFNTIIGLMISKYPPFNYLMVDLSILISTAIIYTFSNSNISDGFKIGLAVLFSLTGLVKTVCSIATPPQFQDNVLLAIVLALTCFEALCFICALALKKFN
jgi:hypothetical protein